MKKLNTALASLVVITALGTPAFAQDQRPQPAPQTPTVPAPTQQAPTVDDRQRPPVDMQLRGKRRRWRPAAWSRSTPMT